MKFRLGWKSDPETLVTRQFSKGDTIGECCQQQKLNCFKKQIGTNVLIFVLYFVVFGIQLQTPTTN